MDASFADPVGAFVPHGRLVRPGAPRGPLAGLSIAVKDLYDWAGVPTGAGNPTWLATHPVPDRDAGAVAALLAAGAALRGKTITDELAYSIHGNNVHYGTPRNAAASGRVPGGSSSGSAAAVAADLVDAALGTDTGGSVRVPAAYCGLYGLRTTHGRVDASGVVPLAPSFDTVGWLARSPRVLRQVAEVLLPAPARGPAPGRSPRQVWTLEEAEALTDDETRTAVARLVARLGLPSRPLIGLTEDFGGLEGLRRTYATVQGWEAWRAHGPWIRAHRPDFAPPIASRFEAASRIVDAEAEAARAALVRFRAALRAVLADAVLVLPSAAGPAPLIGEDAAVVDEVRTRTMRLTSPAGLGGLPQLTVPFRGADGLPRGVGILGGADTDLALIDLAIRAAEEK